MYNPDKEKLEKFLKDFADLVNGNLSIREDDIPEVAQLVNKAHNTLQASMVRTMFSLMFAMTQEGNSVDGRNRHAIDQVKRMIKGFGIVIVDEQADGWKLDGFSPKEIKRKKANFLESFNNNPFIYMGVAFV